MDNYVIYTCAHAHTHRDRERVKDTEGEAASKSPVNTTED